MKTQLIKEATLSSGVCIKPGITLKFNAINSSIQKALELLIEGIDESHVSLENSQDLLYFYCHLEELRKQGFLRYQTGLLTLVPFNEEFSILPFVDQTYQLSRFTLCRLHEGQFVVENPLIAARGYLSQEGMQLIHALGRSVTAQELMQIFPHVPLTEVHDTLSLLLAAQMITGMEEESSALAHWEFHDLLFHARSREGKSDAAFGSTFRFKDVFPSQPAIKECLHESFVGLPRPEKELPLSLEKALLKRRSVREHGKKPIDLKQLADFLWHCARVKKMESFNEEEFAFRPYPGGGARYELEIYPVIYRCEGVAAGVYYYHPLEHQLGKISELTPQAEQLLIHACQSTGKKEYPQVLLLISARFQRVTWKYQSLAYALILKNVGALIQTMYLVATASDLAPCAIGGGNSALFCKIVGTNYLEETSVGEFMLGSLPEL